MNIVDGTVAEQPSPDASVIDVSGHLVAPGLVDLQCNGGAGVDLRADPERLWELARILPQWGVTAWLPTIVTSPPATIDRARATLAAGPPDGWSGAVPLGLHLEGPFLSPHAAGAHPVELLRTPSPEEVVDWSPDAGIALVTLAPELDGARAVIADLSGRGVVVSVGHSRATPEQVAASIASGAVAVTHLFNAMSPLHHRAPGVVGAALGDPRLTVGLIVDGLHVDPLVVGIAERALGERLVLVSDAVALLGVDGVDVTRGVRLPDGTLAGSVLPLVDAVRNLVEWTGCTSERALAAASTVPARLMSAAGRGSLDVGSRGDAIVLSDELELVTTVVAGDVVHSR